MDRFQILTKIGNIAFISCGWEKLQGYWTDLKRNYPKFIEEVNHLLCMSAGRLFRISRLAKPGFLFYCNTILRFPLPV